ncbi:MAG: S41 family peptidase, partial [Lentisphaeraceae bacterium]|nr:S41 family peptidase [Lentisphaeraceae bacterium]
EKAHQKKYFAHGGLKFRDIPIVILIDGGSASASEILSACLHDYGKAVLVGEKSYGKGSVQTIVDLRDGSAIRFTIAKYYTKSGTPIHNVGIKPDVEIKLNKEEQKSLNDVLGDLYPLDSELSEYDKDDRQLNTAISILQSIDENGRNQEPLKIFKDNKASILEGAKKFLEVPETDKPKGTSTE